MSNRESWKTWAVVAALLIFAGLASAVVPFLLDQADEGDSSTEVAREPLETTIDVSQLPFIGEVLVEIPFIAENVQGQPITALQAFGIAFGVVLVGVGAVGLLITIVAVLYDRLVNRVYSDESYQEATAELQQREKARIKEVQQGQPPAVGPEKAVRSRWSMGVYAFIFLLFVWIVGLTLGTVYFGDTEVDILGVSVSAATLLNLVLVLLTIVILYLALRRRDPEELENPASDDNPVNWGYIWIIVSGLLIVGIGAGAAVATRGGG
ncbi:MAG: hypothetical protein JSW55_09670 [Chloroflexota bacterium]|nr:MAG: hypothetical protein JSW55_09670 [Chloroflexota bacterium]